MEGIDEFGGGTNFEMPRGGEEPFSLVVLPDTQFYAETESYMPIFYQMLRWIREEKDRLNIKAVLHVGDLVNDNEWVQWERIRRAFRLIEDELPFFSTAGNHDLGSTSFGSDRSTLYPLFFDPRQFSATLPHYCGSFGEGEDVMNSYFRINCGGQSLLILTLEFGPRQKVLAWANSVVARFPEDLAILVTHDYLDQMSSLESPDGRPQHSNPSTYNSCYLYGIADSDPICSGQEIWDGLVSQHENFRLVFNGHFRSWEKNRLGQIVPKEGLAASRRTDLGVHGNTVHQMFFNAQWAPNAGDGFLRLLDFDPTRESLTVRTLSPWHAINGKDQVSPDPEQHFRLSWDGNLVLA